MWNSQNLSSSFLTVLNYFNKFQMIKKKLFKWSFDLITKEIKILTLGTSLFKKKKNSGNFIFPWKGYKNRQIYLECILSSLNHLEKFESTTLNCSNSCPCLFKSRICTCKLEKALKTCILALKELKSFQVNQVSLFEQV